MLSNRSAKSGVLSLSMMGCATFLAVSPALAGPVASLSRTTVAFGHISVQDAEWRAAIFVTNTGDAPLNISGLTIGGRDPGVSAVFMVAGTCVPPVTLPPNARCRVDFTAYDYASEIVVVGGYSSHATFSLQSDSSIPVPDVALTSFSVFDLGAFEAPQPTPAWADFAALPPGMASEGQTMTIANVGKNNLGLVSIGLTGGNSNDFTMTSTCVAGAALAPGTNCQATIAFQPTAGGPRATELQLKVSYSAQAVTFNATYAVSVTGVGGAAGPAPIVTVVEFYNMGLDHYFITYGAQEISDLDTGVHKGWARTGYSFKAYTAAQTGTSPVCRFYIPPAQGDSHFFGRGQKECDDTAAKFPTLRPRGPGIHADVPASGGRVSGAPTEVYRVFSNRADANHRYMTDPAIRR